MEFPLETDGTITIRRFNYSVSKNQKIYTNKTCPLLGIAHLPYYKPKKNWALIHTLTSKVILCSFNSKEEVERYMDYLSEAIDIDSLFLYDDEAGVQEFFGTSIKDSYMKFLEESEEAA